MKIFQVQYYIFLKKKKKISDLSFFEEIQLTLKKLDIIFSDCSVNLKAFNEDLDLNTKNSFFDFIKKKKRLFYFLDHKKTVIIYCFYWLKYQIPRLVDLIKIFFSKKIQTYYSLYKIFFLKNDLGF